MNIVVRGDADKSRINRKLICREPSLSRDLWSSWLGRCLHTAEIEGSNPPGSTFLIMLTNDPINSALKILCF